MVILNLELVVSYCCYGAEESSKAFTGSYDEVMNYTWSHGISILVLCVSHSDKLGHFNLSTYGWLTLRVPSQGLSLLHLFLRQASSWSPGCYASGLSFPTSAWSGSWPSSFRPICSLPLRRTAANSDVRRHGCGCCGGFRRRVSPAAASPGPALGLRRLSEHVLAVADSRLLHGVPSGHDPDVRPLPFGCGAFPVAARHGASTPRLASGRRPRSFAPTPHDPADNAQAF